MTTTARRKPPKCNGLDGKNWLKNSISIWSDLQRTAEEKKLKHPAMFPVALARRLIDTFTHEGAGVVLDPFAGSGSTLVAAEQSSKRGVGFELYKSYFALAASRVRTSTLFNEPCSKLSEYLADDSVDLCITSPPYWNIMNQKRSADLKAGRTYGDHAGDLGNVTDYRQFLGCLEVVFYDVFQVLKPGAYCCVVVMDLRKKAEFFPFHSDVADRLQDVGFKYDDLIIWDRRADYNNFKPLGYPSVFRVNKAHEFIVIAQKPKA